MEYIFCLLLLVAFLITALVVYTSSLSDESETMFSNIFNQHKDKGVPSASTTHPFPHHLFDKHMVKYEYRRNKFYGLCGIETASFYVEYEGLNPVDDKKITLHGCIGEPWISSDNKELFDLLNPNKVHNYDNT